jgi:hypothetical protein
MPKKNKGHHKDDGNIQQRITDKAVLPENSKACTTRAFIYQYEKGAAKQKLAQLDFITPLTSSDDNLKR